MSTIERQLELEQRMIDAGASAYMAAQRKAEEAGRGSQLDYSQNLMKEFVLPLTEALATWLEVKGPGKFARARVILREMKPEKTIFITLRCLFDSFTWEQTPAAIASNIGRMIEDEMRFTLFQQEHGAYYDQIIQDFKRKGTEDYRHMHRVLTNKANEKQQKWVAWEPKLKVDIGIKLLDLVLENTDLVERQDRIEKSRNVTMLVPTEASIKWIKDHEAVRQFMYPERQPCIIPPDPWTGLFQGGYYSPMLRQSVPLIKAKAANRTRRAADLSRVMRAVNGLQAVPWTVNTRVLEVLKDVWRNNLEIGLPSSEPLKPTPCPIDGLTKEQMTEEQLVTFTDWKREAAQVYLADKERISRTFQVSRILRMAEEYKNHDKFWYVWYADFRGRLYSATAGFSPQGPDLAKGLIRLHSGKALGSRGWYWLRVHIANRIGYDKVSYNARVEWVDNQRDAILACCADPLSNREIWANADKPYQCLAALFEYGEAVRSGVPETFVSHLPIGLDGSCNGLQNFSAMLRDRVGGTATNLTPSDKPSDIYALVAAVTDRKVREILHGPRYTEDKDGNQIDQHWFAQRWLEYGIGRKDAKRPVMTLPYGATRQSCTQYIYAELIKKNKNLFGIQRNFKAAVWLTPLMWAAIGEVVVAARQAMDWLQKSAGVLSKAGLPIEWQTADGFVAYQKITHVETVQIDTQLAGRFQVRVGTWTDEIDPMKQRLGIAPNFVHSQDATHMRMTINALLDEGITDFAFIHDDYGTHACDTDTMHRIIREQFVKLYTEHNPLKEFSTYQYENNDIVLPPLPPVGDLDLSVVLKSPYFFG